MDLRRLVAVDAVIIEVFSCNNVWMRYIFKGEKPANLPVHALTKDQLAMSHGVFYEYTP